MRNFGLIGYTLEHSYSADFFNKKFEHEGITDCSFQLFPLKSILDFPKLIKKIKFEGLSVTIPYKQSIIPFLDKIDAQAAEIGAINCIKFNYSSRKPVLTGFNTDAPAFETILNKIKIPKKCNSLILGNGGASLAVAYVLRQKNIEYKIVTRQPSSNILINYKEVNHELMMNHQLIINTTPVGMYPQVKKYPNIPVHSISPSHICIDLIYNPERTMFMKISEKLGAQIFNGLGMLHAQANYSWEIWNK